MEASKRPLPDAYLAQPNLGPGLPFFLDAFWELSSDRQIHMGGEGAIPFTSIDRFAVRAEIEGAEFWRFKSLIRRMDGEYISHRSAVRERMRKQAVNENENRDVGKERVAAARVQMTKKKAAGE